MSTRTGPDLSPRPKRKPMITCGNCGRENDPDRGSKNCWYCGQPISQARPDLLAPHPDPRTEAYLQRLLAAAPDPTPSQTDRLVRLLRRARADLPGEARPAA